MSVKPAGWTQKTQLADCLVQGPTWTSVWATGLSTAKLKRTERLCSMLLEPLGGADIILTDFTSSAP